MDEDWERLTPEIREELTSYAKPEDMLPQLTQRGLLTAYQAARIANGTMQDLILGNYRILERIGVGGMGVVFKAEHIDLRRPVAIKMVAVSSDQDPRILAPLQFRNAGGRSIAASEHRGGDRRGKVRALRPGRAGGSLFRHGIRARPGPG